MTSCAHCRELVAPETRAKDIMSAMRCVKWKCARGEGNESRARENNRGVRSYIKLEADLNLNEICEQASRRGISKSQDEALYTC